jgi:hypothetical protein
MPNIFAAGDITAIKEEKLAERVRFTLHLCPLLDFDRKSI